MSSVAIIPARGGSKRIPKKNIKKFNGLPVIAFAIKAARESGIFDEIIVSTDDPEIAEIAVGFGARVPWLRRQELADDFTTTLTVMQDTVKTLKAERDTYKSVCCVYPVTPLLLPSFIKAGLQVLENNDCDYVVSAIRASTPPHRFFELNEAKQISMLNPQFEYTRTQDFQEYYQDAGQFYWGSSSAWELGKPIFSSNSMMIDLGLGSSVDIDTLEDWKYAELLFRAREEMI